MAHLGTVYAKDLGVHVGQPILPTHYVPLPFEKYVTIHTSNKVPAKNYSYWNEVVKILIPELHSRGIKLLQTGTSEDPKINGVDAFYNNTTFKQSFFILQNSMCHVGIDSVPIHIASAYNVPTVGVYGHTFAKTCSPLWSSNFKLLEPRRKKKECPSFAHNEDPKRVDSIPPEKIANSVFEILGFKSYKSEKTQHIGSKFLYQTIDIIPAERNKIGKILEAEVRVRMDLSFNENALAEILSDENQVTVITQLPINTQLLDHFKGKISKIRYHAEEFDEEFLDYLRYSNIPFELFCEDEQCLSEQRNKFFNFDIMMKSKPNEVKSSVKKMVQKKDSKIKFYFSKFYMLDGRKMITIAKNYKDPQFWVDAQYFRFYTIEG